jgi:hypothetical protein
MARPKIELTAAAIAHIEEYAGRGCTLHQIALQLDVSDSTLDRWMQQPQVKRAWERGRAIAAGEMTGKLYNLAMAGDTVAVIFWLKSQLGWSDKPLVELPSNTQVVVYVPENGR